MDVAERRVRSFFERPVKPRPIRITPRDLALLENIARLRLVTTEQLAKLDGGSEQNVSRCLLALWEHGYVERPKSQIASRYLYAGSFPAVYGLTRKGAGLLRKNGRDMRRRLVDGIDKQHVASWRFVEHTTAISEFAIALELAVKNARGLELLERGDILEDAPEKRRDRQARLVTNVQIGGKSIRSAVVPDLLYGLRFVAEQEESYFFLERDRGMTIERYKDVSQTYVGKKFLTYLQANREQRHVKDLGIENFRVTTVTTTPERVEKMIDVVEAITGGTGSNIFLFTDEESLAASNPLDLEWVSGKGARVRLTD
jgi:hypothetical protein